MNEQMNIFVQNSMQQRLQTNSSLQEIITPTVTLYVKIQQQNNGLLHVHGCGETGTGLRGPAETQRDGYGQSGTL